MTLEQAAIAYQQSPIFKAGFVVLLLAGAALGLIGAQSGWALRIARGQPGSRARLGLWLSLGSMVGSTATACINGGLALFRHVCVQGPPNLHDPVACRLGAAGDVISLGAFLVFLSSFFVWPPWREPSHLQAFRMLHAVAGTLALMTTILVGWD
ncbi:MAG TPA: hypothetical protein VKZ18_26545 [Polyangia bacterium]|nr:hypothetical protein [Polyangia bacterium]